MKSLKLALMVSCMGMAVSKAQAVNPKNEAVQEEQAIVLFNQAQTLSQFKHACEKAQLFQFAKLAEDIAANPKLALQIEKNNKYKNLAAVIKARFGISNLKAALAFARS